MERAKPLAVRQKTIVFLAAPDAQILDVAGPFQVFVRASERFVELHPRLSPPYAVQLLGTTRSKNVRTNCGLSLSHAQFHRDYRGSIDTLLVAGGSGVEEAAKDRVLLAWLTRTAKGVRRIGSICTGAY